MSQGGPPPPVGVPILTAAFKGCDTVHLVFDIVLEFGLFQDEIQSFENGYELAETVQARKILEICIFNVF